MPSQVQEHFGLREQRFERSPNSRYLLLPPAHREYAALSNMECRRNREFVNRISHATNQKSASAVIGTALVVYSATELIAVGSAFSPRSVLDCLPLPSPIGPRAAQLVVVSRIGLGLLLPCSITTGVLRALQRYDVVNLVTVIGSMRYVSTAVAVLLLGGDVVILAAASILCALLPPVPALLAIGGWVRTLRRV
jgi:hypothetical protein